MALLDLNDSTDETNQEMAVVVSEKLLREETCEMKLSQAKSVVRKYIFSKVYFSSVSCKGDLNKLLNNKKALKTR